MGADCREKKKVFLTGFFPLTFPLIIRIFSEENRGGNWNTSRTVRPRQSPSAAAVLRGGVQCWRSVVCEQPAGVSLCRQAGISLFGRLVCCAAARSIGGRWRPQLAQRREWQGCAMQSSLSLSCYRFRSGVFAAQTVSLFFCNNHIDLH